MQEQIHKKKLADIDITAVKKESLADVTGVTFDTDILKEKRAAHVLRIVKNPYCFRVGDMGVQLKFMDNVPSLEECLTGFLQRKKRGL